MVEFGKIESVVQQILPDPYQEELKDLLPETGGPAVCVRVSPAGFENNTKIQPDQLVSSGQPENLFRTAIQPPLF